MHKFPNIFCELVLSLPAWGGWIEIGAIQKLLDGVYRPSPHGEGGLKSPWCFDLLTVYMSLPAWGGWIEIQDIVPLGHCQLSLPAWGGWIEIAERIVRQHCPQSLPAWGGWIEITVLS